MRYGFRPRTNTMLKRDDDSLVSDTFEVLSIWKNHFNKLLNTNATEDQNSNMYHTTDLLVDNPALEEVKDATKMLKNCKSSGKDNIPAEYMKCGGKALHK